MITLEEWQKEEAENLKKIENLCLDGHTKHCAYRQVWGDGCCTCRKGLEEEQKRRDP